MTRCCSSFANCSPSPASVTINRVTHNYLVAGDQIAWRQERFTLVSGIAIPLLVPASITHPDTSAVLSYSACATLARAPVSPYSVKVFLRGSVGQRPLLSYADGTSLTDVDYFIIGDKVYFTFVPDASDSIEVDYVGIPQAGDPTALEVGSMSTITLPDPYAAPSGYILADGTTAYSMLAYSALYAKLVADGGGIVIAYDELGAQTETYADAASFTVPPGSFVVRYLDPTTYAALPEPESGDRTRSATHRVVIKA